MRPTNGALLDVANLAPGDEIRVQGDWLDVYDVIRHDDGRVVVRCDDGSEKGRTFLTYLGVPRRIRKAPPPRPTVSRSAS